jgi:hypothetical protein
MSLLPPPDEYVFVGFEQIEAKIGAPHNRVA